ncbi:VanZ family protein [Paenibacillus septentrionalis]|uniref:VanZ family protein n=1 Tax=Paenibacillus septentrionalis TaxID=429342 RepID=A0ABW1V3S4_9BACL
MDQLIQYWRIYNHIIPMLVISLVIILLIFILIFFIRIKKKQVDILKRTVLELLISLNVISICFVTLYPTGMKENHIIDLRLSISSMMSQGTESFINLLLFLPLAYFCSLRIKFLSKYYLVLCFVIFSLLIEVSQYVLPLGRITTLNDVILNSVGAVIGIILSKLYLKVMNKEVNSYA